MGASGWEYYVPYETDINLAFHKLRELVYHESIKYYPTRVEKIAQLEDDLQYLDKQFPQAAYDAQQAEFREYCEEEIIRDIERLRSLPEPQTISEQIHELLVICGEGGTGSILDMTGIADKPGFADVSPLSAEQLISFFDTVQPTREIVEANLDALSHTQKRDMGNYIVIYKKGQPSEIYFGGFSGD